ncbi:MAG: hypothetical protein WBX19_03200 [Terracidiphilus sp.]
MSRKGEATIFVGTLALLLALTGYALQVILLRRTKFWPKTWATIHSAHTEVMELDRKTDIMLPCFTFSYAVADKEFSGRFSLFTNGQEEGESVARQMIERRFEIRYNPKRPWTWYIPDKKMAGYEVEQKMGPQMEGLYPKD